MNKLKLIIFLGVISIFFTSCTEDDNTITPPPAPTTGSIYIESTPDGAEIWLDGVNTGKVTPDSMTDLDEDSYNVTLKLENYFDTTFVATVVAGQVDSFDVTLVSNLFLTKFGPVRIYETFGTTADQPSGLDLSSGMAYGVSGTDKDKVDIYYSTSGTGGQGYLIQSAHLNTTNGLTRVTDFNVSSGTDLNDGIDSPLRSIGTWTDHMSDREVNYVFLYDDDNHYSKILITSYGGGVPGEPAWVEVEWWYNDTVDDNRF